MGNIKLFIVGLGEVAPAKSNLKLTCLNKDEPKLVGIDVGKLIHYIHNFRGICYFFAEVQCAAKDLHSGVFGGTVWVDSIYKMIGYGY